ncbi:hypothetical protein V502_08477 [Pseudogymnoascus sp. VKM F-4520 (FW-2644)]|nr:hypothetical protein V502_08477 [Pseudogymnoascus sp. VKM F-4520 (FW-2644)]
MSLELNANADPCTIDTWVEEISPRFDLLTDTANWDFFVDSVRGLALILEVPPPSDLRDEKEFFQNLSLATQTCHVSEEGDKYLRQLSLNDDGDECRNPGNIGFCGNRTILLDFLKQSSLYEPSMMEMVSLTLRIIFLETKPRQETEQLAVAASKVVCLADKRLQRWDWMHDFLCCISQSYVSEANILVKDTIKVLCRLVLCCGKYGVVCNWPDRPNSKEGLLDFFKNAEMEKHAPWEYLST